MDGGSAAGAITAFAAISGFVLRVVIRADRHERIQSSRPQAPRSVPRSALLDEPRPRPRRSPPEPEDERPPVVEVPDRLLVRAARIAVAGDGVSAAVLAQRMPVIPAMAGDPDDALGPDYYRESGRGLVIVDALADGWGHEQHSGHTLYWAELWTHKEDHDA